MGETWSAYIKDDDLNEKIEEAIENGRWHNQAHFFTEAAENLLDEENEEGSFV